MKTLLLVLLTFSVAAQTNLYVNVSAPGGGNGSFASPYNTIQTAINAATPNSYTIINVRGGTYRENLWIEKSGTSSGYLTIKPYLNEVVRLDGTNQTSKEALIIQGSSYVRIEGLIIQNYIADFAKGIGIYCTNSSTSNIQIVKNEIYNINVTNNSSSCNPLVVYGHSASNAAFYISNILIAENKVHDCNTGWSEGIQVNYDTRNFEIRSNEVYNITNIGIVAGGFHGGINRRATNGKILQNKVYNCKSPFAIAAGIYIDGAKNVTAERNTVYNCQKGMSINCEINGKTAENDTLRNNYVYLNTRGAFNIGGNAHTSSSGYVINSAIINNSTFQNFNPAIAAPGESSPINFGEITLYYAENSKVINNIFYAGAYNQLVNAQYPSTPSGFQMNYNLWFSDVSLYGESFRYYGCSSGDFNTFKACSNGPNSLFSTPYYQAPAQGNLNIRCASQAINAGSTAVYGGATDYSGTPRVRGTKIDIGADEFERYKHLSKASGNWLTPGTWALNLVPLPCDDVVIKSSHKVSLNNGQNARCKTLETEPNAVLDAPKGAVLLATPN